MEGDPGVGIYKIIRIGYPKNRVVYVGQSRYLRDRIKTHKKYLRDGKHCNPHLQNVHDKYGESSLRYEIVCLCRVSELNALEQFYIDELKPECNIIRDIKNWADKFYVPKDQVMLSVDIPGLELDWEHKVWHKWVYGCGRGVLK